MSSVVIDASIAGALLLDEELTTTVLATQEIIRLGVGIVPVLFQYEVANLIKTCSVKWTDKQTRVVFDMLESWPIQVDHSTPKMHKLCQIALECSLSVYDAVYLELAHRQDLPLATLDRALAKAAKNYGVKLLK